MHRESADTGIRRRFHDPPERFDAGAVTFAAGQSARPRPAAVAVHDRGNMQ
jgi:hypothetical protein